MKPMNFPGRKASRQKVAMVTLQNRASFDGIDTPDSRGHGSLAGRRSWELGNLKAKLANGDQSQARTKKDRTSTAKMYTK